MSLDPNVQSLFAAIRESDVTTVKQVLAAGVSANSQNTDGQSAIAIAASLGNTDIIEALIAGGAELNPESKPLVLNPRISGSEIPGGGDLNELIAKATEDAPGEAKAFYTGFMEIMNALSGRVSTNSEVKAGKFPDDTRSSEITQAESLTGSVMEQPIPVLLSTTKGTYYGTEYTIFPEDELESIRAVDVALQSLGFQLLGKLSYSHFSDLETYAYALPDGSICASVNKSRGSLAGIDLVTSFLDDTFLTTTTVPLQIGDYPNQKLFRRSHPNINVTELCDRHIKYTIEFEDRCGAVQLLFSDLRSIAVMVDVYLRRQAANPMHGVAMFVNALKIVGSQEQSSLPESSLEEDEELEDDSDGDEYDEDDEEADTPLMAAVISGNVEAVKTLLNSGAAPNPSRWIDSFPFVTACRKGYVEIVRELIAAGANVNAGFDCLPLHTAAGKGHLEIVRLLLEAGADVEGHEEDAWTALMSASSKGHLKVVKLLVEAGANVSAWSQGATPLMLAASGAHPEVYDFLYPLVHPEIRRQGDKDGKKEMETTLKRREREANKAVEKFIDAAMYGKLKQVQAALATGIDVNAIGSSDCTALMYAASYGHIPVVQALLEAGADPNILSDGDEGLGEGMTALMFVAGSFFAAGKRDVVAKMLIQAGADVNLKGADGNTALMCGLEHVEVVKVLLEAGANFNAEDDEGNSVLMLAQTKGSFKGRKLLEQAGASQAGLDKVALVEAVYSQEIEKVKALIQAGVDVNYQDGAALVKAASKGNLAIVELLIQAGANVNLGAKSGFTPLANAAYRGDTEIVELLMRSGADIHARTFDGDGDNALEYAETGLRQGHHKGKGHRDIIAMLEQAGVKRIWD